MSTLTKTQREALEAIRDSRVTYHKPALDARVGVRIGRVPVEDFGIRAIRGLAERGLIELTESPRYTTTQITDAGRAALGDWAAGERIQK